MIADEIDVESEALHQLPVSKLHERFVSVYGEAPRSRNRVWLIRKILWRLQSLKGGSLSERARQRATELAADADVRLIPAQRSPAVTSNQRRNDTGRSRQSIHDCRPPERRSVAITKERRLRSRCTPMASNTRASDTGLSLPSPGSSPVRTATGTASSGCERSNGLDKTSGEVIGNKNSLRDLHP